MVSCESTQSYTVPLKACRNTVIDHNLVTIWLRVEWPEKGGDDPNLVIDIANKQPSRPYLHPNPSSLPGNPIHQHHPHQENMGLSYQQKYYHSSGQNNHDHSSNSTPANSMTDHNDVLSTTTTTVVYNSIPPRLQTSSSSLTEIQKIKTDLQSQFQPILRHQSTINQQYLSSQHVIHTPLTNMNETRLDAKKSTICPPASIKPMPTVMTQFADLQQSSTIITPPMKPLVCTCPHPTSYHINNCAIFTSNNQESNTQLSSELMHRQSITRPNPPRIAPPSQAPPNTGFTLSTLKEPVIATTYAPFSNSNIVKPPDSSTGVTTIISQPSPFLNKTQVCPTIKTPSLDLGSTFQHPSLNIPQLFSNNQSNYQANSPIQTPTNEQQTTNSNTSRPRKTQLMKRNSSSHQDQTLIQNLNNSSAQIHFLNNQNSPKKVQNIKQSPNRLSSPIQTQQGMFVFPDNSQITDKPISTTTNDTKLNTIQQPLPRTNSMVRSPVLLDIPNAQNLTPSTAVPEAVDQTITEVISGKGDISLNNSSKSTTSQQQQQQQQKQPISPQMVWSSNGPLPTTRTYLSPLHQKQQPSTCDSNSSSLTRQNVVEITSPVMRPNFPEQNQTNTVVQQQPKAKPNIKRKRPEAKRPNKSTKNTQQQQQQQQTIISTDASTSNVINNRTVWSDTSRSLASSGNVTTTHIQNANQHLIDNLFSMPDIAHNPTMLNYSVFNVEPLDMYTNHNQQQTDFDDIFHSKVDDSFPPSTPLFATISMTDSITNSVSTEQPSSTLPTALPSEVYNDFFPTHTPPPSSSIWDENQTAFPVLTSSNIPNNTLPVQQYYSETNTFFDTNVQPQTLPSQFNETNLNTINPMNNNDDVQTSTKPTQQQQQTKKSSKQSSKVSKQKQNRPNVIQKSSSTKRTCTRCGHAQLVDITHYEFPKQKGLVFECTSCGNNSLCSNVSAEERKRRLDKVAADHLHTVECQFCHKLFHSHNEYLTHLKDDHGSNKPM